MTRSSLTACVSAAAILLTHQAQAQIARVSSREALAANTSIEWFAFGRDGAFLSTPVRHAFGSLKVELSSSSGGLLLRRESADWTGDFVAGQYLLAQPYASDNFMISFNPPVSALGTQMDPVGPHSGQPAYSGRFLARLCLYGANGAFLGMVQTPGTASTAEDGSARFLGARSFGAPIGRVSLQVSGVTPGFAIEGDVAVDRMDVVVPPHPASAIPAGATLAKPPACS